MNPSTSDSLRQHIYQVTELNLKIKRLLEESLPFIWICGEISNLRRPSSGHCYFTLKDSRSQLGAVMFRAQAASLRFRPEDGQSVIGLGRVSVYEPRGSYQVIFEYLEPMGVGGLQIAFEKLKLKLFEEGLFDARHKTPLPVLPKRISVVTSPSGAAVRDFINVSQRRFPNLPLEVAPVAVQGRRAPGEIVQAIRMINSIGASDVIVLARGGGSIEDLAAFNDERVARAIFASRIPVVSAIGHETDFTIADFVSDLRAPTPSAAAELVVPSKNELEQRLDEINLKLYKTIHNSMLLNKNILYGISSRITHPLRRLHDMRHRLTDHSSRLESAVMDQLVRRRERAAYGHGMLMQVSPARSIDWMNAQVAATRRALAGLLQRMIGDGQADLGKKMSMLDALNPMAILKRGYSITRTLPGRRIVRTSKSVKVDQSLEVLLGSGKLTVTVEERTD